MKKYSWIVALLLALSLAFLGCPSDDKDDGPPPVDTSLKDLVIDGTDIVLKWCGNSGKDAHVNGNQFILVGQDNLDNVGFYWEFPAEVKGKGYGAINVEMEVISIDSPDFIGFMTHSSSSFGTPVAVIDKKTGQQKTGQYDHEFKLGVECVKGAAGDEAEGGDGILDGSSKAGVKHDDSYPFAKFSDRIAFQVNKYAGNITTAGWDQKATFTIAVTKVTFVGGAVPDSVVDEKAIPGVIVPATGGTPVAAVGTSSQYTGTVTWAGTLDADGKFVLGTAYTATITLTAKEGFTLTGVAADFFTVAGATATNPANSGVVTAVFPATENPPTEVVLFDLATWLTGKTDGVLGDGDLGPSLQRAGGVIITKAGNTLVFSSRTDTWQGVDIKVDGFTFDYNTYDYTLTVEGYTSAASNLKAGQTGSPYNEIGRVTTDGTTTVVSFIDKPVPENDTGSPSADPPVAPKPFGNIRINSDVAVNATTPADGGTFTLTKVIFKGVEK